MREIRGSDITAAVRKLAIEAAHILEPDILRALETAAESETSDLARDGLQMLLKNAAIAAQEDIPLCQDTGISIVFLELGQDLHVDGDLTAAVQEGVRAGYDEGYLRKSVCDPLTRKNTGTNVPAVVHTEVVAGDRLKISFLPKGCGSENMSGLTMLPPSAGRQGIIDYVVDRVKEAGPNPCPPVIVGIGLGGSFEKAAFLAKKALLRPVGMAHPRHDIAALEGELLARINHEGQGVLGWGGSNTALAVHVDTFPTHIASLPVAVNMQCHSHRHKEVIL
jgi:fumarate hydratase subunit alpha